ncbi:MAG: hypothetical protein AAGD07_23480 [Planctomycetota bacterium]
MHCAAFSLGIVSSEGRLEAQDTLPAQILRPGNQVLVVKEEAKLFLDDEIVGKTNRGSVYDVLEVDDERLKITTETPTWISVHDVAGVELMRQATREAMVAEDYLAAVRSITNVLKLERDRNWFDYATRAQILPKIVLKEEDATIEKLPVAIPAMTLAIEDWKKAKELGKPPGQYTTDYVRAHQARAECGRRLAKLKVGDWTLAEFCRIARDPTLRGDRDFAEAGELLGNAADDYGTIIDVLRLATMLSMSDRKIRDRFMIRTMLHRMSGDCFVVAGDDDRAIKQYELCLESARSARSVIGHTDNAAKSLFGQGLIAQRQGDTDRADERFSQAFKKADGGTPGLEERMRHYRDPSAERLPNLALRSDGTRMTLTEQIVEVVASIKQIDESRVRPDQSLESLGLTESEALDLVEAMKNRLGVTIGLIELKRYVGIDAFEDVPLHGTVKTMAQMFQLALESRTEYGR